MIPRAIGPYQILGTLGAGDGRRVRRTDQRWRTDRAQGARVWLRAVTGQEVSLEKATAIAERTGGNPLFVEQIGSAELDVDLPWTVEAAVQSHLDHLPAREKSVMKHAAVLGRSFGADALNVLCDEGDAEPVASLCRRDLLGRKRRGKALELHFKSQLVFEVAYRLLTDAIRVALHRRVAESLVAAGDQRDEEIALHFERGAISKSAAHHYARAALQHAQRSDSESRDCGPCPAGVGDCDYDIECLSPNVCHHDVGPNYGLPSYWDMCECPWAPNDPNYCRDCGPCPIGTGDCDDDECARGAVCSNGRRRFVRPSSELRRV